MLIFITGANGLVGSEICKSLLAKGHSIRATRRSNSNMSLLGGTASKIEWVEADILDLPTIGQNLDGVEAFIHAAAMVSFDKRDHSRMMKINVDGTAGLVNLCIEQDVPHFLLISSIAAIGRVKNIDVIDEKTKWQTSELNSQYAISKYHAEMEVWRGGEEGLKFTIVNPSVVLGMGDLQQSSAKLFKYVWDQKPFYTDAIINYIDVKDVSDITSRFIELGPQNDRFILNAGDIYYKEFFQIMAMHLGKRAPFIKASKPIVWAAVIAETLKGWITGSRPLVTAETAKLSQKNFKYRNNKIKEKLGIEFSPLEQTIERICSELKEKLSKEK